MLIPVVVLIGIDTKPDGIVSTEPTT